MVLSGHSGSFETTGKTATIYYPQGDWTNYYIAICAEVTFKNGATCSKKCKSFLLNCGSDKGNPEFKTMVFPNPTKNKFAIQPAKPDKKLAQLTTSNSYGIIVQSIQNPNSLNYIDLSEQGDGIYFLWIRYTDGSLETKKIIKLNHFD